MDMNPRYILAITGIMALASSRAIAQADLTIAVADRNEGKEVLRWGFRPGATQGVDRELGESEYPPNPPEFLFEARWNDPAGKGRMGQGTKADFRAPGDGPDTFLLRVQTAVENYPVTLNWPELGDDIDSAELSVTDSGGRAIALNMKTKNSFTLENAEPVLNITIVVKRAENSAKMPGVKKETK